MTIYYDERNQGIVLATFSNLQFTVLPILVRRVEAWLLVGLHVLTQAVRYLKIPPFEDGVVPPHYYVPWNISAFAAGLLSFTIVFYTNQCFGRYEKMFALVRGILCLSLDVISEMRLRLPKHQESVHRLVVRYLVLSMYVFFYEVKTGGLSEADYAEFQERKLLLPSEQEVLEKYTTHRSCLLQYLVLEAIKAGLGPKDEKYLQQFTGKVFDLRKSMSEISDTLPMQMPFQYFHMVGCMLFINLSLWAYGLGLEESIFSPLCFICFLVIFLGMKEVCVALTDPFGDDEVDFPIEAWLQEFTEKMSAFVEHRYDSCTELEAIQSAPLGPMIEPTSQKVLEDRAHEWFKMRKLSRHDLDDALMQKEAGDDPGSPRKKTVRDAEKEEPKKEEEEEEEEDDD